MCKKFDIARNTALNFILNEEEFSLKELQSKIIANGGVLRISTEQTLLDYLSAYEEKGFIKYIPIHKKYKRLIVLS